MRSLPAIGFDAFFRHFAPEFELSVQGRWNIQSDIFDQIGLAINDMVRMQQAAAFAHVSHSAHIERPLG
jgi:hypothetical protein